jgi:hypothetical protein
MVIGEGSTAYESTINTEFASSGADPMLTM